MAREVDILRALRAENAIEGALLDAPRRSMMSYTYDLEQRITRIAGVACQPNSSGADIAEVVYEALNIDNG